MEQKDSRTCCFRRPLKILLSVGVSLLILALLTVSVTNLIVYFGTCDNILPSGDRDDFQADLIVVLGAGLRADGTPSDMLRDRVTVGVELYEDGAASRILMTGDRSSDDYDEPRAMEVFATESLLVDSGVIDTDGEGYSTFDSLYRIRNTYGSDVKILIVTQTYHLYRALDIAATLGLDARGVSADLETYRGQSAREGREILARSKDFFKARLSR